ncbi:hypothetical protein [Desulfosporosinus sp. OT]|uniref:hypothetical protein n=1 Tax=Desulfosporosinus sp. OT TaxID=913865 RepID=UPI000223A4E6|nr:hypothetical protein [Desulfosporosinus sp. OT]EGW36487.1 hypothetical protein DOT_5651 [Desulfosporosinus sp. OT]
MPRMGHANPRTYGKILKDSKREVTHVYSETTRKFNVAHYETTGEVKYLDEEEEDMPTVDQKANAKRMKTEITSIEQFEAIGNYKDVAIKYHVAVMTAHGLMRSLRSKKSREEAGMVEKQEQVDHTPTLEDIEKFHTDVPNQELPKVEFGKTLILNSDELYECREIVSEPLSEETQIKINNRVEQLRNGRNMDEPGEEVTSVTFCKQCGDIIIHPPSIGELCGVCAVNCRDELDKAVEHLESKWTGVEKVRSIEDLWKSVESDVAILHKMTIAQAEKDFQTRLSGVFEGC